MFFSLFSNNVYWFLEEILTIFIDIRSDNKAAKNENRNAITCVLVSMLRIFCIFVHMSFYYIAHALERVKRIFPSNCYQNMTIASEVFRVDTDVFVLNIIFPVKICGSHCVIVVILN